MFLEKEQPLKYRTPGIPSRPNQQNTKHNQQLVNASQESGSCNCWIERDSSFHIAEFDATGLSGGPGVGPDYRNDDWSTDTIELPFSICFYGTAVNKIFLNNNGNI